MNIFMKLWQWICSIFSTKSIHTKTKIKELDTTKKEDDLIPYKLTDKDWELLKEQNYFKNLAKGKACVNSRDQLVISDSLIKVFKLDPEFFNKREKIQEDPKTLDAKRRRKPVYIKTNRKLVKALVDYKQNNYTNLRLAFKAHGVSYSTLTHQRNEKERTELHAKADLIVKNNSKSQKEKEDNLKEEIKARLEKEAKIEQKKTVQLKYRLKRNSKVTPKVSKAKAKKIIKEEAPLLTESFPIKKTNEYPRSLIVNKEHAEKVLVVYQLIIEELKKGMFTLDAMKKYDMNKDQLYDLRDNWFPELELKRKWKSAQQVCRNLNPRTRKSVKKKTKISKEKEVRTKITRKSGTFEERVTVFNEVCELMSKGTPIREAMNQCMVAPEVIYDVRDADPIYDDTWELAKKTKDSIKNLGFFEEKKEKKEKKMSPVIPGIINDEVDTLFINPQQELFDNELKSIMKRPGAVKELTSRIDDALLDYGMGKPLEEALKKHKVDEAKFHQYHRLQIGNIVTSMKYAEAEYSKFKASKNN